MGWKNYSGTRKQSSRRIIGLQESKNLTTKVIFIDFRKAFDNIHRGRMRTVQVNGENSTIKAKEISSGIDIESLGSCK